MNLAMNENTGLNEDSTENVYSNDEIPDEKDGDESVNLKDRLGKTKVYLYSDVATSKKLAPNLVEDEYDDELAGEDGSRPNAIMLSGTPISFLKTQFIFAYATHFESTPAGLEWVDDTTVVFVYPSTSRAKAAWQSLHKLKAEEADEEGFVTAKPIPLDFWPLEIRLKIGLGAEEELDDSVTKMKGRIRMRSANVKDVKQQGAASASKFYKKFGQRAGKEMYEPPPNSTQQTRRKRRGDDMEEDHWKRARLDAELDSLRDGEEDHVETHAGASSSAPRQSRHPRVPRGRPGGFRSRKGPQTQQELDDELDAFLRERDV